MRWTPLIALLIITLPSCDRCKRLDGPRERYEQLLLPVNTFELLTPADVTITKDTLAQSQIEVFAQPEVYHILETDVRDRTCTVSLDGCFKDQETVLLNAYFPSIKRIFFASAGSITSSELIKQDTIRLENTGLGDIDLTLNTDEVIAHITSSGNIVLSGIARRSVSLASGSGEVSAFNLLADTAVVHTIGSGIIEVYADHLLEVHFWNPTTVRYKGQPDSIVVHGEGTLLDANF